MRAYKDRKNVQKKSYHSDRFMVAPETEKKDVSSCEAFASELARVKERFEVLNSYIELGQMVVYIKPSDNVEVVKFFKEELKYDILTEVSAIDWIAQRNQFEVFYQMLSTSKKTRIRIKCALDNGSKIDTVENIFRSANFGEREMYDMFGIVIEGHSFLRRILMPEDWVGYPLLKTYPLQGDEAAQWYEVDKIFGKEARDIIGPENRDPAKIDRYDTTRFARLGHEVSFGENITDGEEKRDVEYQESEGVLLIQKMNPQNSKVLDEKR